MPSTAPSPTKDDELSGKFLLRPLGSNNPPSPTDNTGKDMRTPEQKKADFTDYTKHLQRRKQMYDSVNSIDLSYGL